MAGCLARSLGSGLSAAVLADEPLKGDDVELPQRPPREGTYLEPPHLRDFFPGIETYPSPFCTKNTCEIRTNPRSGPRNPLALNRVFISEDDRVLLKSIAFGHPTSAGAYCDSVREEDELCDFTPEWCTRAGPRSEIVFKPADVHAAIVTCGGLCPGLNDVIRQIVITLESGYGVKRVTAIPYGFRGFHEEGLEPYPLTRKTVENIHLQGGTFLGTSRGGGDVDKMVDSIQRQGINMLFVLGGNGTHAGANAVFNECARRGLKVAVVGVPKTIDNDILLLDKTFGFDTAVEEAQRAIRAAAIEARSALRGVGVVKLMGRQSGFIAMHASLASGQVDVCLIPEVPFKMDGSSGVLEHVKYLLETQGHAVVCLAEGAGQDIVGEGGYDASGNPILGDIGKWFSKRVKAELSADVKYIDPTYMVRGVAANAHDAVYCAVLGQNAVHGAFAGYTGCSVGLINTHYAYLPIDRMIESARVVDPDSRMWHRLLSATGQPDFV